MTSWRRGAVIALCLLLPACGLRPIYGDQGTTANADLSRVEVATVEGRVGQRLRNQLIDRFQTTPRSAAGPDYVLNIRLNVFDNLFDDSLDSAQLASSVSLTASYQLVDRTGRAVNVGTANAVIYKTPVSGQFALFVNQQDAYDRAIDQVAGDLTRRISLFLARDAS
ncbi:LPS assembly lipoprotein LptE [Arenibaculum pallidiluteum]|uniref:LPS assembly lipoprotein LptE n=1 Tax=Arenibaculum pallidiluteum TaxID=2812559 RepID=UPI001A96AD26|nr:LPS assembly lipoprotein LptE [Arenibaculum pallidiluteum]